MDKLNISSNEAAASLEETAAALEQITSNIRNNTQNIAKMASYSDSVTKSASDGEKLANQTHDVAVITDQIAKLVVSSADEKEFKGKNEVKGRSINVNTKTTHSMPSVNKTSAKTISKPIVQKVVKNETVNVVKSKPSKDDDEWESF